MTDKRKKRIRARMARTGESYQAVVNANRPKTSLALACDMCGEDLLPDPGVAMVMWLTPLGEGAFRDVIALFFVHKGPCVHAVESFGKSRGVVDTWDELEDHLDDEWEDAARCLRDDRNWPAPLQRKLDEFHGMVSVARHRGWRPNVHHADVSDPTEATRFDAEQKAFKAASATRRDRLNNLPPGDLRKRVEACFAPDWLSRRVPVPVPREPTRDEVAAIGRLLHDESERDDDGFIAGAGFDRYGGFPGDGLS